MPRATTGPRRRPQPRGRAAAYLNDVVLENWALEALSAAGKPLPRAIPALSRLAAAGPRAGRKLDRSDRVFANERRVRFTEMEYACRASTAREAARRVIEWVRAPATRSSSRSRCGSTRRRRRAAQPLARAATPPTSPSTSTAAWSGAPTSKRSRRSWTTTAAARTGASATSRPPPTLAPRYPRWGDFQAAREQLDPGRVFANEYSSACSGRWSSPRAAPEALTQRKALPSPR